MESFSSFADIAESFGLSPTHMLARRVDGSAAAMLAAQSNIAASLQRHDVKRTSKECKDTASAFFSSELTQVLEPIVLPSQDNFLFVPGRTMGAPLLPVTQRLALGQQTLEWDVFAHTGEARKTGPGGLKNLRKPNTVEDRRKQGAIWYGARFGHNQWDLWRDVHLTHRNAQAESREGARMAMDEMAEDIGGYGDDDREVGGFWNTGSSTSFDITKSLGDPTLTFDELLNVLGTINILWKRMNPQRTANGIAMPVTHMVNVLKIFSGVSKEGHNAWEFATKMYKWLANIIEDDRLLTAGPGSTPIWQMWSSDPRELYYEAAPNPMVFGPFTFEFDIDFITLNRTAGVMCRNSRRILRVHMPAVA